MSLYSQRFGSQDATRPTAILMHGIFGMGSNLSVVAKALQDEFNVLCIDLTNHGRSHRKSDMDFRVMSQDVLEFMDQQDLDSACLVGHSMGGKVGMQIAFDAPDRIKKLVVSDIAPVEYPPHYSNVLEGLNAVNLEGLTSRSDAEKQLAEYVDEPYVRMYLLKNLFRNDRGAFEWRLNLPVITACYDRLRCEPISPKPFIGDVLFVKGELSPYIRRDNQAAIEQWFPNYRFKMIQGAGHWVHADKPAAFNKVVRTFLLSEPSDR